MSSPLQFLTGRSRAAREAARCMPPVTPEQAENSGIAWLIGAFLICPCHLPVTLGVAASLLSGTVAAAVLHDHRFFAGAIITVAWLAGTWRGLRHIQSARKYAEALKKGGGNA